MNLCGSKTKPAQKKISPCRKAKCSEAYLENKYANGQGKNNRLCIISVQFSGNSAFFSCKIRILSLFAVHPLHSSITSTSVIPASFFCR